MFVEDMFEDMFEDAHIDIDIDIDIVTHFGSLLTRKTVVYPLNILYIKN
jgi:hypothetical protein